MAYPTLNPNLVLNGLANQVISQITMSKNVKTSYDLADKFRKPAGNFGDTLLVNNVDIAATENWGPEETEAANLLETKRARVHQQAVVIDTFKKIWTTVGNYVDRMAFSNDSSFSQFIGEILAQLQKAKQVYEYTLVNSALGTTETSVGEQMKTLTLTDASSATTSEEKEAAYKLRSIEIAKGIADVVSDMSDAVRDFNDLGYLNAYPEDELIVVANKDYALEVLNYASTIYHDDRITKKIGENAIPARFFGDIITTSGTVPSNNTTIRSLVSMDLNTVKPNDPAYDGKKVIYPGDLLPAGYSYAANTAYTQNPKIIAKIVTKDSLYFCDGFLCSSAFVNARAANLTNHYVIFSHNSLVGQHIAGAPFVTIKEA